MKKSMRIAGALALATMLVLAACGGDDSEEPTAEAHTDGAFIAEMVPHHEGAIEMAEVAVEEAEHPEVRELAESIISSQGEEIAQLEAAHQRLFEKPIGEVDHGSLGLSEMDSGMAHDASALAGAEPFDQEFIDMMIPHHQGAIRMARVELAEGSNPQAKQLATQIIAAQAKEITAMNKHRTAEFGGPSPAGGVPAEGGKEEAKDGAMQGMDQG